MRKQKQPHRRPSPRPLYLEVLEDRCLLSSYTLTNLGTLGGQFSYSNAYGLNKVGQVVGWSTTPAGPHAFLWDSGVISDLGTLGGDSSFASGINDAGQAVGYSNIGARQANHAFLWQDGVINDLGTLGGSSSYAFGINNVGQVVGLAGTQQGFAHAFRWQDGVMIDLGTLDGGTSRANAINDAGQVVGEASVGNFTDAFFWDSGVMTDLGTLPNYDLNSASAINNVGHVVGSSTNFDGDQFQAFFSDGGALTPIGPIGTHAWGINDSDQIVGSVLSGDIFQTHAFIYADGVFTDLNDLIPHDSGFVLETATSINNNGQIAGTGFDRVANVTHAFLLTPKESAAPRHRDLSAFMVSALIDETASSGEMTKQLPANGLHEKAPAAPLATLPADALRRQATDSVFASFASSPRTHTLAPESEWELKGLELGSAPILPI